MRRIMLADVIPLASPTCTDGDKAEPLKASDGVVPTATVVASDLLAPARERLRALRMLGNDSSISDEVYVRSVSDAMYNWLRGDLLLLSYTTSLGIHLSGARCRDEILETVKARFIVVDHVPASLITVNTRGSINIRLYPVDQKPAPCWKKCACTLM